MTIYVTPFSNSTKQTTGPSADSGFASIADVVAALGEPVAPARARTAIYGPGEERVIFSDYVFRVDPAVNTG